MTDKVEEKEEPVAVAAGETKDNKRDASTKVEKTEDTAKKPATKDSKKDASTDVEKTEDGVKKPATETAADLLSADVDTSRIRRAKKSKNVTSGQVNVLATFNNTKVNFADTKGNVISWSSAGKCNFRGSRKSTAYAAQVVTQDAGRVAMSHGLKEVVVKLKGPGMGRDAAVRALQSLGFIITAILDVTPVPHNGCRPPKRRRV